MSLIKCSECGKEISDKAEICINCGNPIQKEIEYQKMKNKKNYDELTKEEKKKVNRERFKNQPFDIVLIFILFFVVLLCLFLPPYIVLSITIPIIILELIYVKSLNKKYYEEKMFFASKKKCIKEQDTYIEKDKTISDKKDKTNYYILIIIILIAITIYTIINIKSRISHLQWNTTDIYGFRVPKKVNINNIIYNISQILNYLIPCIELWLLFLYYKYKKITLKKILKIIGIIGCLCLVAFFIYWKMFASLYSTDFIIYTLITTLLCFILMSGQKAISK